MRTELQDIKDHTAAEQIVLGRWRCILLHIQWLPSQYVSASSVFCNRAYPTTLMSFDANVR